MAVSGGALLAHGAGAVNGSPGPAASLVPARPSVVAEPPIPASLPVMTYLYGVSCPSARTCLATGPTTGGTTAVARWNGTKWTALPAPGPARDRLAAIWCASATSCLAVGDTRLNTSDSNTSDSNTSDSNTSDSKEAPLAERWNGSTWTVLPMPNPVHTVQSDLTDIDCTSVTACTAVGSYTYSTAGNAYYALAEGWNGKTWRLETAANPAPKANSLYSVSCTSPTACETVGDAFDGLLAESWNGTAWTGQTPVASAGGGPGDLNGVSCASATDCFAVGDTGGDDNQTLAESWNGKEWAYLPTLAPSDWSSLSGAECFSATNCLAVGAYDGQRGDVTLAVRRNGHTWTVLATRNAPKPAVDSSLGDIACASPTACLAIGHSDQGGSTHQRGLAEWWNGTKWTMLPTP
jgi:hypothetical protein